MFKIIFAELILTFKIFTYFVFFVLFLDAFCVAFADQQVLECASPTLVSTGENMLLFRLPRTEVFVMWRAL